MRDVKRIDKICKSFNDLWKKVPDFRFWQVIGVLEIPKNKEGTDPFFWEDDEWLKIIEETIKKYS